MCRGWCGRRWRSGTTRTQLGQFLDVAREFGFSRSSFLRLALLGDPLFVGGLAGRRLTTRLNLAMPSCDGFLGRYVLADGSIPGGFGKPVDLPAATALTLEDGVLGGDLRLAASIPAEICGRPQQTVSQSEAGFEKIMQCVELSFQWTLPDDQSTLQLQLTIHKSPP